MKIIIAILLLLSSAYPQYRGFSSYSGFKSYTNSSGEVDPYAAYFFAETFDATGYDNTWAETGTVDEDYTTTVLQGTQSLYIADGTAYTIHTLSDSLAELYVHFIFRSTDVSPASQTTIFSMRSGTTQIFYAQLRTTGVSRLYTGTTVVNGTHTLSNDTAYNVWLYYKKGTGANGISTLWYSTNGVKPGSAEISITNGNAVKEMGSLLFNNGDAANMNIIYDQLIINETNFTTVP